MLRKVGFFNLIFYKCFVKKIGFVLGEIYPRPQSEIKATTPVEKPPPPPQSAPPEYSEQVKMEGECFFFF